MRPRELQLVVAFDSTASALVFETNAPAAGLTGRLIPVPTSITAGCGLAWRESPQHRCQVQQLLQRLNIQDATLQELVI